MRADKLFFDIADRLLDGEIKVDETGKRPLDGVADHTLKSFKFSQAISCPQSSGPRRSDGGSASPCTENKLKARIAQLEGGGQETQGPPPSPQPVGNTVDDHERPAKKGKGKGDKDVKLIMPRQLIGNQQEARLSALLRFRRGNVQLAD